MNPPSREPTSDSDLDIDYKAAGFSKRLGFGYRPALIIIDFCHAYLDIDSPLYAGVEDARASSEQLLKASRAAGIPVVHTRVEFQPDGANGGVFFRKVDALKCFIEGNPLAEPGPGLEPWSGEVIVTKQYASAFFGTSLASTLTTLGVDTLIHAGVSTSGCVRATALDACQHGFVPIVVREAVGDRDQRVHDANLFDLDAKYADVVSQDETLKYLHGLG
ncbi:MAG: isochorismatase family protein [Acidimicrobiaceae bacterium]|jgi:maleamate amidohydrolase|nr:isochorismatase family protein [Acidimicrobiaceae bacterium]MBT5579972.1 isochorismatase family protein [Acidimicrobiaceae bacterium]MBT5850536.1 isochorismatase family protein [Acidimicrobiaceae bacterium]